MRAQASRQVESSIRSDRSTAIACLVLGALFWLVVIAGWRRMGGTGSAICFGLGVACFGLGAGKLRRVSARRYGISVEKRWGSKAAIVLRKHGFDVATNVEMPHRGDIDLAVTRGGVIAPVEIKSFHRWRARDARSEKTAIQVQRQMAYLHTDAAFVWLPLGRQTLWQWLFGCRAGAAQVVFGSPRKLARAVDRRLP